MRLLIVPFVFASVVLPALAQEGNEAEKLFRTFEKKLVAAGLPAGVALVGLPGELDGLAGALPGPSRIWRENMLDWGNGDPAWEKKASKLPPALARPS